MRPLLVLLLALPLSACAYIKKGGVEKEVFLMDAVGYEVYGEGSAEAPPGYGSYLVAMNTKKKAAGTAFGVLRANRRLYAPFEMYVVAGLVPGEEQAGFSGNSQICVELDERSTFSEDIGTLLWVLVCARREGTGLRVRAQDQFSQLGSVLLPDTDAAVLAIRHDGTDLIFETGPATLLGASPADGGLAEIARIDNWLPVAPGDALVPSMGTSFVAHPASVGFSHAQVLQNGDPPPELTDAQDAAFDIGPAVDAAVRAFELLDGAGPDPTAARDELVASQDLLETALGQVEALPVDKLQKKARGAVKAAIKQVAAAIERIDHGAAPLKVLKKVGLSARSAMKAIEALDPLPAH